LQQIHSLHTILFSHFEQYARHTIAGQQHLLFPGYNSAFFAARPIAFIYAKSFFGPLALLPVIQNTLTRAFAWACKKPGFSLQSFGRPKGFPLQSLAPRGLLRFAQFNSIKRR
jgi:hypothetical protein